MRALSGPMVTLALGLTVVAARLPAQSGPKLASYYTILANRVVDPSYTPKDLAKTFFADVNGDGNQDAVVLGSWYPPDKVNGRSPVTEYWPQPGRVLFGDGNGGFTLAPSSRFPPDELTTLYPNDALFGDLNQDGRLDMFVVTSGWDAFPWPGEQNRLYLSTEEGGWRDATATLPQINDFTHSAAMGDLAGRGVTDIFVGNGFTSPNGSSEPPYALLNSGSGQFSKATAIVPVGNDQLLDSLRQHNFSGCLLADLDGDGLPDLIVTASARVAASKLRRSTILWNRGGAFSQTDVTELPLSKLLPEIHVDYTAIPFDLNQDGLPDLIIAGTQGAPAEVGWSLQLLVNRGNHQFADETDQRLAAGDMSRGLNAASGSPSPRRIRTLDFNNDGITDFAVEFNNTTVAYSQDQPIVWLNDGTGHFSTLTVGDFVAPGQEARLGRELKLVPTKNGYSFFSVTAKETIPLSINGLVATKPYR